MPIYQLSYRSKAAENFEQQHLEEILQTANFSNERADISGCLIYHNNYFVQILEGAREDVLNIFNKISADNRHKELTILWEGDCFKRYFEKWNMLYHNPQHEDIKIYLNNLTLLSKFSETTTASLLSFWVAVRKIADS